MSDQDWLSKEIAAATWYHSYEVMPGIITPGRHFTDAAKIFDERYALPKDLSGLSALDIGALDGPYSFELESRGAKVTSIDIQHPDRTGFNTAKRVRKSDIRYIQGDVYDLSKLLVGETFDIVTFFGVFYHLKNPVLAFEQLRAVVKDSGLLLVEGECLKSYAELPSGVPSEDDNFIKAMGDSELPLSLFYSGAYKGDTWSWYVPNVACVKEWLKISGFELLRNGVWSDHPHQRMFGTARKIKSAVISVDNPIW